ncbi:Sodium channel protein type 11 subunit alpha [Bienertia sinuspersici]
MSKLSIVSFAMNTQKKNENGCLACAGKGHTKDKCWNKGKTQKQGMQAPAQNHNNLPLLIEHQVE